MGIVFETIKSFSFDNESVDIHYLPVNHLSNNKDIDIVVNKVWNDMCLEAEKQSRKCFDSPGYSIDNISYKDNHLVLSLSNTTYKQYITTFKNKELLNRFSAAAFPKLLSVFGFVLTADNYFVFGDNSSLTRSSGQYSAPGGTVQKTDQLNSQFIYNEFKREVFEETGITEDKLINTKLISVVIKDDTNNTPRLVFASNTTLLKNDIELQFLKSDKEFNKLIFIKNNTSSLKKLWLNPKSNWTVKVLKDNLMKFSNHS